MDSSREGREGNSGPWEIDLSGSFEHGKQMKKLIADVCCIYFLNRIPGIILDRLNENEHVWSLEH